jgi:hypothetical protein
MKQGTKQTNMSKAKLGFNKLSVANKVLRAKDIVAKTTGNPHFPNPVPSMATITTAIKDVETAESLANGGGKKLKTILHTKVMALEALITSFISYVDSTSGGDAAMILSSGLDVRAVHKPKTRIFTAKPGKKTGSVLVKTAPNKAVAFKWQYGYDQPGGTSINSNATTTVPTQIVWMDVEDTTTATTTIENLKSGYKIWIRYAMVFSKPKGGQRPWSDAVAAMVA